MIPVLAETSPQLEPVPSERRGICPTLQKPMQTGDGLLARLRPVDSSLTLPQLRALARAAADFGNGIVEITARGSLQARGLQPQTVAAFESAVLSSGIDISVGVGIETPPLAGLDPDELLDVRPLAEVLRMRIAEHVPPLVLAPKLAITIDGGGRFHLGHVAADIKVATFREGEGIRFVLAAGGRAVGIHDENQVVDAVIAFLEKLSGIGPAARGKDLDLPAVDVPLAANGPAPLIGIHRLSRIDGNRGSPSVFSKDRSDHALGLAFTYRQADSASLIALADAAEQCGARDIRLAPGHGLFVTGLTQGQSEDLQRTAATLGFLTALDDPRRNIALCAGSRGCASGFFDTRTLADKLRTLAPDLLDGSLNLHLSGCPKGCAHPAPASLTFVGARAGYGLVVNGAASGEPDTYIAENHIDTALQRLQALTRQSKEDGETARACLARLGTKAIAAALQLDGT